LLLIGMSADEVHRTATLMPLREPANVVSGVSRKEISDGGRSWRLDLVR